jgi:DNA polymerase
VCDSLKRLWREAHPGISGLWRQLGDTVKLAFDKPGGYYECGKLKVRKFNSWLHIIMPSGRALCYASPKSAYGKISYMGTNPYTKKWERITTYSGKFFENFCQATARDVMAHAMPVIEDAGYCIISTVHDEIITEVPDTDNFTPKGLSNLLAQPPPWALDIPLAASGFSSYRYKKE